MSMFLINLLIVVLILWIIKEILIAVDLGQSVTKIIWIIAIVIGVIYLLFGFTFLPFR